MKLTRDKRRGRVTQPNWIWYDATALHRAHRIKSRPVAVLPHMKCIFDVKLFCSTINWIPWIGWKFFVRLLTFASVFQFTFRMVFSLYCKWFILNSDLPPSYCRNFKILRFEFNVRNSIKNPYWKKICYSTVCYGETATV